jgi:hypothetical protein
MIKKRVNWKKTQKKVRREDFNLLQQVSSTEQKVVNVFRIHLASSFVVCSSNCLIQSVNAKERELG